MTENVSKIPPTMRTNRLKEAQIVRKTYHAEPAAEDTAEDILKREYWVHFRNKGIRPGEKIELRWEGGGKYAELIVIDTDQNGLGVCFIVEPMELSLDRKAMQVTYTAEDAGPHVGWRVLRDSDRTVIQSGFPDEDAANLFIKRQRKAA